MLARKFARRHGRRGLYIHIVDYKGVDEEE